MCHGAGAWPGEWVRDCEYRDRLLALGAAWDMWPQAGRGQSPASQATALAVIAEVAQLDVAALPWGLSAAGNVIAALATVVDAGRRCGRERRTLNAVGEACEQASAELIWAFSLLGKRWTGVVIAVLMNGPAHFAALHRAVPGISERMLSDRLSELAAAGLVSREVGEGPPLRVRYQLTDVGLALRPALQELVTWAHENQGREPGREAAAAGTADAE